MTHTRLTWENSDNTIKHPEDNKFFQKGKTETCSAPECMLLQYTATCPPNRISRIQSQYLIKGILKPIACGWCELKEATVKIKFIYPEASRGAQSCPTLCDPMDCSPPGSTVHGNSQARILEWVAISFSRGASSPRN